MGILHGQLYKLVNAFIFFMIAGYIYKSRLERINYEGRSNLSLLEDLEQAIRSIDYHAKRQKYFIRWYMLSIFLTIMVNAAFSHSKPCWLWIIFLTFFAFAYWAVNKELSCRILPKKEDLIYLRSLLLNND